MDEVERRYADSAPSWLIPRLAAVQNLRQLWAESAQKRADDHRLQMRAIGAEDIVSTGKIEMPGDISIQGDTYNVTPPPPPSAPGPQPTTTSTSTTNTTTTEKPVGLSRFIWPAVLGAVTLAGGAGGMALYNWLTDRPQTITTINQPSNLRDWKISVVVKDHP